MTDSITDSGLRAQRAAFALNKILGLSQEEIARRLNASYTTVNAWVTGRREPRAAAADKVQSLLASVCRASATEADRARAVVATLHVEYGSPRLGNKDDPLDELFYILLSLKTSYLTYEETYEEFARQFRPWSKLLDVGPEDVEQHIRRGGLGSLKARAFVDIARRLKADFGDVTLAPLAAMPAAEAEAYLTTLPGVGIKTARCVMMYSLGQDVLPVDTHTYRVGARLGLVETSRGTRHVHVAFDAAIPKGLAYALHTNFVAHGRAICQDPTPKCEICPVREMCPYPKARAFGDGGAAAASAGQVAARAPRAHDAGDALVAVDIYAGCGGLSAGLEDAGFDLRYALDWDKHACATHEANFPKTVVECRDVREVDGAHILAAAGGRVDLVAGGPNCQGLSQRGLRNPDDPRNFMLPEFVRLVSQLEPRAFIMENVPGLAHRHNFGLLKSIFASFRELGYTCAADVLLAADFGVPQLRYRFFLVGMRDATAITFPAPTHTAAPRPGAFQRGYVTVGDAIGDLPELSAASQREEPLPYIEPADSDFRRYAREGVDAARNHVCSATEKVNLDRAIHIPEGGNWKDIPPAMLPPRLFTCRMTDHSTTYARLRRDHPAFTITSLFGNITAGAFTHPLSNRALSVREGARLQSFRDRFVFAGARNSQYRQIGNAVPPLLGRALGAHVRALLLGERVAGIAPRITEALLADPRAWDALPVLTPRFKALFGTGTRWPKGWGEEPADYSTLLDKNYSLRPEFVPAGAMAERRKAGAVAAEPEPDE